MFYFIFFMKIIFYFVMFQNAPDCSVFQVYQRPSIKPGTQNIPELLKKIIKYNNNNNNNKNK